MPSPTMNSEWRRSPARTISAPAGEVVLDQRAADAMAELLRQAAEQADLLHQVEDVERAVGDARAALDRDRPGLGEGDADVGVAHALQDALDHRVLGLLAVAVVADGEGDLVEHAVGRELAGEHRGRRHCVTPAAASVAA